MSIDYLSLAVSDAQRLAPYVPGKPIEELERETGLACDKIIKSARNETPLMTNPHVMFSQRAFAVYASGTAAPSADAREIQAKDRGNDIDRMQPENARLLELLSEILSEGGQE